MEESQAWPISCERHPHSVSNIKVDQWAQNQLDMAYGVVSERYGALVVQVISSKGAWTAYEVLNVRNHL